MKKLSENTRLKRSINLFSERNQFGEKYLEFELKSGIRSIDLPQLCFNNYYNPNDKAYSKFLFSIFKNLEKGIVNIDEEFEYKPGLGKETIEKLNKIHLETYFYQSSSLPMLHRLKKNGNEKFQLYCRVQNKKAVILFVDLHHLIIDAKYHDSEEDLSLEEKYKEVKTYCSDCISKLIKP